MPPRLVVFVVYPDVQGLDVVGPAEVFATANRLTRQTEYRLTFGSMPGPAGRPVATNSGLAIIVDTALATIQSSIDLLVVTGGRGVVTAVKDKELIGEIRRLAGVSRRVTSVCSGSLLLAEAGLLDGRRATSHWQWCEALAHRYPRVTVDPDPIYVQDGDIYTSAGVTAGMDLALALVEDDLGRDVALSVARQLVLFLHRPANQAQLSAHLSGQLAERSALREAQRLIAEHPGSQLGVADLADQVGMSERNFARCFKTETGITPGRYVERVRLEAARRLLEDSDQSVATIATGCGFGTAETMRRSFLRALGCGPNDYRQRFGAGAGT